MKRFANAGLSVTGMDISENSIKYARESATGKGLSIDYLNGNYLDMSFCSVFDAIFIISQDFCVLSPFERAKYLDNVRDALKPGGYFVFDMSTPVSEEDVVHQKDWYACDQGFWSAEPQLVLEKRFYYAEDTTYLYQYVVATNSETKVYRIYQTHYTKEFITGLLASHGLSVVGVFERIGNYMFQAALKILIRLELKHYTRN